MPGEPRVVQLCSQANFVPDALEIARGRKDNLLWKFHSESDFNFLEFTLICIMIMRRSISFFV